MFSQLRNVPQPMIAAVHGFALGGGTELAATGLAVSNQRSGVGSESAHRAWAHSVRASGAGENDADAGGGVDEAGTPGAVADGGNVSDRVSG
jgi:hypothetical protein